MFDLLGQVTYTTTAEGEGFFAALAGLFFLWIVLYVVGVIALWKVFEKAGVEGWKAIIPIYNFWVYMEIAGKPGWWGLIGLTGIIPVIGWIGSLVAIVLWVLASLELAKAFGKDTVFAVVGLVIFSLIGLLILGFGDAKYTKPKPATAKVAGPPKAE